MQIEIELEHIRLIMSLLAHSDPTNFYTSKIKSVIEKQVVAQLNVANNANNAKPPDVSSQNKRYEPNENIEIRPRGA